MNLLMNKVDCTKEVYKNIKKFNSKTGICYIPIFSKGKGYRYHDFLKLAGYDERIAKNLFDLCNGQDPYSMVKRNYYDF